MANSIKVKRSATASSVPTTAQLALGELAINTFDGKLFIKKDNGTATIVEIGGGGASVSVGTTPPVSPSAGDLWWASAEGKLKIYYTDANTSQWVDAATGTVGSAATIAVGTTTTGNAGTSASVTNIGTSSAATFDFSIPRGTIVALGSTTTVNPNVNPSLTDTGTSGNATYNFSLPRASAVSVGSTTTGSPGSSASVANTGTNGDTILGFTIPRGDTGTTGATGAMGPKSALLQYPTTGDTQVVLFYTTVVLTISKIVSVLPAGSATPSASFNVRYGSDVSAAGTAVTASAITTTSISTGTSTTTFSSATISAGSFVWVAMTAVSGTVPALSITLEF
jgi:hypothetical protein